MSRRTKRPISTTHLGASTIVETAGDVDPDAFAAAWLGERLRRVALGATAALLTARAFWPSEPDLRTDAGSGLLWVLALWITAGIALAGAFAGGTQRFRWSWADLGVIALVALVGASAGHGVERRVAINLAWEWSGFGLAYLLVRNLPRTRGESNALIGALAATAVAVAVYGLWQVAVELPAQQLRFARHRLEVLQILGIAPGTSAEKMFVDRLMGSNEPFSTFALANSLAGFLVGPLVVMLSVIWDNLTRREGKGSRAGALLLAVAPLSAVVICLLLTKSRSAYIGLTVGVLVLAWRERTRLPARTLALAAVGVLVLLAALVTAGLKTGRLDRQVLTESGKSLRYRQEYWIGAWRAINESPRAFWSGFGPGNFPAPYLRHKLPQASEEINDPHNFVLEVWSTAGVLAVVALGVAVVFGLINPFLPLRKTPDAKHDDEAWGLDDPAAPPRSPGWLLLCAAGGWILVLLVGHLDLIGGGDFERWVILGGAWALAVACGVSLWRRRPLDPAALGAAALATFINLSAAGGIGFPAVALTLWSLVALGSNLRDDRAAGRLRGPIGRLAPFALAALWAALLGSFVGGATPYWKAEAALNAAQDAIRDRPPDFNRAEAAYIRAQEVDRFSARPWLGQANLDYEVWKERGARYEDQRWKKIPVEMYEANHAPRSEQSWSRQLERARMMTLILKSIADKLPPRELLRYRGNIAEATRKAMLLYPTNASLHARLAEISAEIGMIPDAVKEGQRALELDSLTPHADKKLEPRVRDWITAKLPDWKKSAASMPTAPPPKAGKTNPQGIGGTATKPAR